MATWNLNSGLFLKGGVRIFEKGHFAEEFCEVLSGLQPDVILLQEFPAPATYEDQFVREIFSKTGFPFYAYFPFCESHLLEGHKSGLAIGIGFSDFAAQTRILEVPRIDLQSSSGAVQPAHNRGIISASFSRGGMRISVLNIHLPPFENIARDPAEPFFDDLRKQTKRFLDGCEGELIFAGDFNCTSPYRFDSRLRDEFGLSSHIIGPTRLDGRQTDNILSSQEFVVSQSGALQTASDHFICWADLSARKGKVESSVVGSFSGVAASKGFGHAPQGEPAMLTDLERQGIDESSRATVSETQSIIRSKLLRTLRKDAAKGIAGWNNFLSQDRPSVLGTAFAVRALNATGGLPPEFLRIRTDVAKLFFDARRTNGGWSASTAGEPGQILESAFVLSALALCLGQEQFEGIMDEFENLFSERGVDAVDSTYVAATVLDLFTELRPSAALLPELVNRLELGRSATVANDPPGWGAYLRASSLPKPEDARFRLAHTAFVASRLQRAFVATGGRCGRDLSRDPELKDLLFKSTPKPDAEQITQFSGRKTIINLSTDCLRLEAWITLGGARGSYTILDEFQGIRNRICATMDDRSKDRATSWALLDVASTFRTAQDRN